MKYSVRHDTEANPKRNTQKQPESLPPSQRRPSDSHSSKTRPSNSQKLTPPWTSSPPTAPLERLSLSPAPTLRSVNAGCPDATAALEPTGEWRFCPGRQPGTYIWKYETKTSHRSTNALPPPPPPPPHNMAPFPPKSAGLPARPPPPHPAGIPANKPLPERRTSRTTATQRQARRNSKPRKELSAEEQAQINTSIAQIIKNLKARSQKPLSHVPTPPAEQARKLASVAAEYERLASDLNKMAQQAQSTARRAQGMAIKSHLAAMSLRVNSAPTPPKPASAAPPTPASGETMCPRADLLAEQVIASLSTNPIPLPTLACQAPWSCTDCLFWDWQRSELAKSTGNSSEAQLLRAELRAGFQGLLEKQRACAFLQAENARIEAAMSELRARKEAVDLMGMITAETTEAMKMRRTQEYVNRMIAEDRLW